MNVDFSHKNFSVDFSTTVVTFPLYRAFDTTSDSAQLLCDINLQSRLEGIQFPAMSIHSQSKPTTKASCPLDDHVVHSNEDLSTIFRPNIECYIKKVFPADKGMSSCVWNFFPAIHVSIKRKEASHHFGGGETKLTFDPRSSPQRKEPSARLLFLVFSSSMRR